ncbi:acetyl-CoA carboxylase biotin carboxylase subunit [Leptospira sarikeiensis]|uniref:ATP-grasp domain-containing protein n=1 Tax=Leptospira sarikeiensis TaxID=2484943 RepID=A0A4R9KBK7_9LEPT|nr:biotin carboxylase N-terminal domain-containing protein [Leptospira sarikeiensis]TGL64114.1 ATP-grasp domain-containing protein [Leptospira sarikeiensis]
MIKKILIANRGEISLRIQKTCRKLGIQTVAVYSDADKDSPFVKEADFSYYLGPPEPSRSYLVIPNILKAISETGADAVHPGYGFLSEKAEFARELSKAGISFLGPKPETVDLMGDKIRSRAAMEKAGVPVVPGYEGDSQEPNVLLKEAEKIGFPVMIKASAGGGGKGMKRVFSKEEFLPSLESAQREAGNAFGDSRVFLEKYIINPRHIEVQVFGDTSGNVIHLFERECSIQRRHQKVVEESPAPNLSPEIKKKICDVAVKAASSIGYIGAGTVEFILGEDGAFYFLEMNTRLQVEHPVTESVTGFDLVEWQIRIAEGVSLEKLTGGKSPSQSGHAIEVRLYAEDPENEFLPSIGKIELAKFPEIQNIRVDSGVVTGSEVSLYYDPMLAKLIGIGKNRDEARKNLISGLEETIIFGPTTNLNYLKAILEHSEFINGNTNTHFLEKHKIEWEESGEEKEALMKTASFLANRTVKASSIWDVVGPQGIWGELS